MTRIYAIAAAAAIVGLIGGLWYQSRQGSEDAFAACRTTTVAGGAGAIGGPFELVDETGATVTDSTVIDGPSLLYFGYSFCPDVCPLDLSRNVIAVDMLAEQGIDVKPVFISVDPARDTPAHLAEFTDYLHPDLLGLTGSEEQIRAAVQAYRAYYKIHAPEEDAEDFYLVDHSTFTYLVFPETGFAEFFRRELPPEDLAEKAACFVKAAA